ncbi:hypothetical protein K458DRAFT_383777 [Lentithecium fluviatile CBS 122367]|uniref:Uncharacterized protein n=1 Tax=Lentithecium fluviatile CBS 122367 TaxID=1168545 RepID=A0A6G1JEX1_9PLEO|nr:hypothetical protein K458DRAFT_383777 [Lentithecium fluviatile CBS 122367]
MSGQLMDTEKGGEQTQYEGAHNLANPHDKQAGQLGDLSTDTITNPHKPASNAPNTQGVTPADKIRYGQAIQEGGMGGKTTGSRGEATSEGGFGGTEALEESSASAAQERRQQGYGGTKDQDTTIGA